jgi:Flp pilus assembly protein TadG
MQDSAETRMKTARRTESGAVFLEFLLSALFFFTIVLVTLEAAIACFRILGVQYLASQTARTLALHQAAVDTTVEAKMYATKMAPALSLAIINDDIQICDWRDLDDKANCKKDGVGSPEDYVAVRIQTTARYLLGARTLTLTGFAMARNEKFS